MERSRILLSKWVFAAQLASSNRVFSAATAKDARRQLRNGMVSVSSAPRSGERYRWPAPLGGPDKVVEADETYVGGRARNKAYGPPPKKMAVFTLVEREGKARSRHVADMTAKTLREAIVMRADRKSYLMTDEALVYQRIGKEFAGHGTVRHTRTGGFHHTNTVESFFALLKRGIYGNFHHVSEAHLHRYLAEFDFATTTAICLTQTARLICCAAQRASGFCIDSLTDSRVPRCGKFLDFRHNRE
jgi:hypothetical protein